MLLTTSVPKQYQPQGMCLKLYLYVVYLFSLGCTQSLNRVRQIYPQPSQTVFQQFTGTPSNGHFLASDSIYLHSEYGPEGAFMRAFKKDGTLVKGLNRTAPFSKSFVRADDELVVFGVTSEIRKFTITYSYPDFIEFAGSFSIGHSLNLLRSVKDENTTRIFVSTSTGGLLFVYEAVSLNAPTLSATVPTFASSSMLALTSIEGAVIIGGDTDFLSFVDKASMSEELTVTVESGVTEILEDKLAYTDFGIFDFACDSVMTVFRGKLTLTGWVFLQSTAYTDPINNLLEFRAVNYLLVASGTKMQIIKRTTYETIVEHLLDGQLASSSIGCCEAVKFKYTLSAPIVLTSTTDTVFRSYQIDLSFCSSYSGQTCTTCNLGFKLNNQSSDNVCITEDEYPPRHGIKGSTISFCLDTRCDLCAKAFYKCQVCQPGFYINAISFNCSTLDESPQFGIDPLNVSLIKRCSDSECKLGLGRSRLPPRLHEVCQLSQRVLHADQPLLCQKSL